MKVNFTTRLFIGLVAAGSLFVAYEAAMHRSAIDLPRFLALLAITVVASRFKLSLPGINGSMSVTLPFILVALAQLSFPEALFITCASTLAQSFGKQRSPKLIQVLFNVCNTANAVGLAWFATNFGPMHNNLPVNAMFIAVAATVYYVANTVPVAVVISMTENKNPLKVWQDVFLWSFPYYAVSAGLAVMVCDVRQYMGWEIALAMLPVTYMLYRSFRMFFHMPKKEVASVMSSAMQVQAAGADD